MSLTGLTGLAAIIANARGATTARRWQAQQEHVSELRTVLDAAAQSVAATMQGIVKGNGHLLSDEIDDARQRLDQAGDALEQLWSTINRLKVRLGPGAPVVHAAEDAERELGELSALVRRRLASRDLLGYDVKWQGASRAERAFYEAAEAELAVKSKRRSR